MVNSDLPHNKQMKDEKDILQKLKNGNVNAFDTIYHHYFNKLYAFCFSMLKDHSLTEEMVQDIFVTLWHKREQINPELQFEHYMMTICYNFSCKHFRRRKLELKVKDYLQKSKPEDLDDTMNNLIYKELMGVIDNAIEKLPEKRKHVYYMSRREGMAIKEIAEKLNISTRTVETHLSRSLKFLRQELDKVSMVAIFGLFLDHVLSFM